MESGNIQNTSNTQNYDSENHPKNTDNEKDQNQADGSVRKRRPFEFDVIDGWLVRR